MKRKRSPSPEPEMLQKAPSAPQQPTASITSSHPNLTHQRTLSRFSYLKKSSKKQRIILQKQLEKERQLLPDEKLSEAELRERRLRERALQMQIEGVDVEERNTQNDLLRHDEGFGLRQERLLSAEQKIQLLEETKTASSTQIASELKSWQHQQERKAGVKLSADVLKENPLLLDEIKFVSQFKKKQEKMRLEAAVKLPGSGDTTTDSGTPAAPRTMKQIRESLPVFQYREQLIEAVKQHPILIVVGETGSGKTTQVPQYMYEAGIANSPQKMIAITQPRRVAAMSVATRVAEEMNVELGEEVGYSIRFEDLTSDKTVLKYMTDGMMLREFMLQPDMKNYSVIMIDEAHERSLNSDILFALVKDVSSFRPDLRIIIASATLEAKKMSSYFNNAPVFYVPGRTFPVDTLYTTAPESDYLEASIITVLQIHLTQPSGDILVFLTGQDEIDTATEELLKRTQLMGNQIPQLLIRPIYSSMPSHQQAKIFEPTPKGSRKVVLATNIAETSLTIDGIVYVVDSGFCKQKSFDPRSGMESLIVTAIAQANADQRKGRAGRVRPGKCYRLYTMHSYQHDLPEAPVPEIQRTNLGNVILVLKSLGINNLLDFDFMDPPPMETLGAAIEQLYALGALSDTGALTKLGRRMSEFPLDPRLSRTLIASEKLGCSDEVATICAMISASHSLFFNSKNDEETSENTRKSFFQDGGDHLTLLHVYNEWVDSGHSTQWCKQHFVQARAMKNARNIRTQLVRLMQRLDMKVESCGGINTGGSEKIRRSFCAGYFYNAASLQRGGSYRTYHKPQIVHVHPTSTLFEKTPQWVIYHELLFTSKEFMRQIVAVEPQWLVEAAPHVFDAKIVVDGKRGAKK